MTLDALLLTLTWMAPLTLGLLMLANSRISIRLAPVAALPALLAALLVPIGAVVNVSSLLLGVRYGLDETGQTFLFFTALLWLLAALFGVAYLREDANRSRFFAFFLLAMAGNFGAVIAGDMISFYMWFATMSFASYVLVIHTGKGDASYAGRIYIILVIAGEVLLFAGMALIATTNGTLLFSELAQQPIGGFAATLILLSFGIKAGIVLLHTWLPLAHPAAPIPASAVLSGAMIKVGVLGWLRFLEPPALTPGWGDFLIVGGLITAFYGAVIGVSQINSKTVLAYSSISQIGIITVGAGAWLLTGGDQAALSAVLLYAMHHALAKGALFLGVAFAGTSRAASFLLLLPALALAGFPLTSGAVAKASLKSVTTALPGGWPALLDLLLPVAAVGTTLLMARYLWSDWHSPRTQKPIPRTMWGAWLVLLGAVAVVLFAWPAAAQAVADSVKPSSLWTATWPVAVGSMIAAVAAVSLRSLSLPVFPPGDVLVLYETGVRGLYRQLRAVRRSIARVEMRVASDASAKNWGATAGNAATRWELRLRTDWLIAGGSLLLIALAILLLIDI